MVCYHDWLTVHIIPQNSADVRRHDSWRLIGVCIKVSGLTPC